MLYTKNQGKKRRFSPQEGVSLQYRFHCKKEISLQEGDLLQETVYTARGSSSCSEMRRSKIEEARRKRARKEATALKEEKEAKASGSLTVVWKTRKRLRKIIRVASLRDCWRNNCVF